MEMARPFAQSQEAAETMVAPARRLDWVPASLGMIAAAVCFCGVIITNGTGQNPQPAAVMMQLNAMSNPGFLKQARFQSLDDELPLKDAKAYDEVAFGLHANEVDAVTGQDPDLFVSALKDCSEDGNCWALRGAPVRGTNTERMPLFRLSPGK